MASLLAVGDFLKRIKIPIEIQDSTIYKRVTISSNHKGISKRDEILGVNIGTKNQFLIKGGDFIMSKIDARHGAFGIIPQELNDAIITGNFWTYKVDDDLVDAEWFFYFTHSFNFIQICIDSSTGSTHRKYIDEKAFLNHKILLPKKYEQIEMVQKYKLNSQVVSNLKSEIETQNKLLSRLKQSILQDAIQGNLTKEWRKGYSDIEPASELLKRIKAERAQLIEEKQIKKEKPLPPIAKEEIPFEIPEGWVWCRLGELCSKTGSGSTPNGGKTAYVNSGVQFIRSQNVYDDGLITDGIAYITSNTHEKMSGSKVQAEDLLLNITGGSIGRCCIVPKEFDTGNINQHVAIIRTVFPCLGYFLHHVICSPYFQKMIIEVQTGAGREGLPKNKMDNILIALPPEKEQAIINEKVNLLLEKERFLQSEIIKSEKYAQILKQAVLKEAFESKKELAI